MRTWLAPWTGVVLSMTACLPGDLRPEPGSVLVTGEPSPATANGFVTDDGWQVAFDRLLIGLGNVDLGGAPDGGERDSEATCNGYSETNYEWLVDFGAAERTKVGLVYGLGTCSVDFSLRSPSDDTVLGIGATEGDAARMGTIASDEFAEDAGVALEVQGSASKDGVALRFDWAFRRSYQLSECRTAEGEELVSVVELTAAEQVTLPLQVRGEELFRRAASDRAALQFGLFAAADLDGDGSVTMIELAEVEAPPEAAVVETPVASEEGDDEDEPIEPPETMADLVYGFLMARVVRVSGGGACVAEERRRRGH